jgi:hypothetical protein
MASEFDVGTQDLDSPHQTGGDGNDIPTGGSNRPTPDAVNEVPDTVRAFVEGWVSRIKAAKAHWQKKAFKRMDKSMSIVSEGGDTTWVANEDNYVVPILNRIINIDVAQLYARNPKARSKRKERMMNTVWDGTLASLREAEGAMKSAAQPPMPPPQAPGAPPMPAPPPPLPPDPQVLAVIQDAERVKQYNTLMDGVAKTMTILHNHFMEDPAEQYKPLFKMLVRRTKTLGVGYVRLNFQRIMEKQPDITAKIDETTEKIATLQRLTAKLSEGELQSDSAEMEELKTTLSALQEQETLMVKEGPFWTFPFPKRVIVDPNVKHLKTLLGANWLAEEMELTPDEIEENWKVDVGGAFTEYKPAAGEWERWSETKTGVKKSSTARVWRVLSKKNGTEFIICEGYPGYLLPPRSPRIKLPRFWDIFPLVFNEVEDEKNPFPPSDVWLARHMQYEYNRTREFLRQHRQQNRPAYAAPKGAFETEDLKKLQTRDSGEVLELNGLQQGEKIADKLMALPVMQIDPKQYEVESHYTDVLRVTGSQQANMGQPSGVTATESSISQESQQIDIGDSRDDLDEFLSLLVQSTGYVMLRELSADTVKEIVGPGAQWPEMPETREELAEEILLETRAGASGRPNQAQDLSKLERAMPYVIQLPGMPVVPLVEKYADLLEIDIEGATLEGLPSISTINTLASQPPPPPAPPPDNKHDNSQQHDNSVALHLHQAPAPKPQNPMGAPPGAPNAPGMQGPAGMHNAPQAPGTPGGPQPHFPSPLARVQRSFAGNP